MMSPVSVSVSVWADFNVCSLFFQTSFDCYMITRLILLLFAPLLAVALHASAEETNASHQQRERLAREFESKIAPLIKTHCVACHGGTDGEAELDLTLFRGLPDVSQSHRLWKTVLDRVEKREMPPAEATQPLAESDRRTITHWIHSLRQLDAQRQAGDPGPVSAHRLSNAQYDYSIRDLTGVDIRPTRTFPIDPANESGFDNTGESLSMSPALMQKYLEACRTVVQHLVFTPDGLHFAPHPVATDTDRDKYCVRRIVDFYRRQPTDYADYFYAAWSYLHRRELGNPHATRAIIAKQEQVSDTYLSLVWHALTKDGVDIGPLKPLQQMWIALPGPAEIDQVREACVRMRDYVVRTREQFEPTFENLRIEGVHKGTQAFVLWKNKQYAAHRRQPDVGYLQQESAQLVDAADRDRFIEACEFFCSVFPDAFFIAERGRDYLDGPSTGEEKGRLLSAGFHSMMGYFRDDRPLQELILDDEGRQELDDLWRELDFFTAAPMRQYQGFLWFDRTDSKFMRDAQFDFARPENQASLNQSMIERLAQVYLAKATTNGGGEVPLAAIREYFHEINEQIRWVEQARLAAEPKHLQSVIELAERAYRRPVTASQERELRDFYQLLREQDELSHEEAIADTIVSILMSPRFLYRTELLRSQEQPTPLDDFELASRLSFFLWSSLPDAELLQHAEAGDLNRREVLLPQTQRMLGDERIGALAIEFAGNWLDFRRFDSHNSVDRTRFPEFDDELRSAMFEEPIRFFVDVVQQDRSILDFLYADRTFVNAALARHYGIEDLSIDDGQWRKIDGAGRYGRGGLLPMAVFLTKNAPGLRTSPVKRGYWVVRRLLGERIPPPPPNVPELPDDESKLGEQTLRETLARHREHASCSGCHDRFDSIGLVFEGFGPIGQRRAFDLGGRPIDASAEFPDGSLRDGVADLRRYLQERRETEFVDNLCRKLLSYGLGRTLQLSDEALLGKMRSDLAANGYRFSKLIESIVTSPQFLYKRGRQTQTDELVEAENSDD